MSQNPQSQALLGIEAKQALREVFVDVLPKVELRRSFSRVSLAMTEIQDATQDLMRENRAPTLVAIGKAAGVMTSEVISRCRMVNVSGVACSPYENLEALPTLETFVGGHPVPNEASVASAERTQKILRGLRADDLVVYLMSGGGSACFESALSRNIGVTELRATYDVLVGCGAGIEEINTVRKHLSGVKGGRLAQLAHPARQITLFVSDVPAGHESAVASGPTMPDETTVADMRRVLATYELDRQLPRAVVDLLLSDDLPETPKPGDALFRSSSFHCLVSNQDALEGARQCIRDRGWYCEINTSTDETDVEASAEALVERLEGLAATHAEPVCLLAGGEVRSVVRGPGRGGRNQAFVLHCVDRIAGRNMAVLSAGTDGIDGNSDAAGAVADGSSLSRALALGLDVAETDSQSDANTFFRTLGDDVVTGPTGNNVRDLRMLLAW